MITRSLLLSSYYALTVYTHYSCSGPLYVLHRTSRPDPQDSQSFYWNSCTVDLTLTFTHDRSTTRTPISESSVTKSVSFIIRVSGSPFYLSPNNIFDSLYQIRIPNYKGFSTDLSPFFPLQFLSTLTFLKYHLHYFPNLKYESRCPSIIPKSRAHTVPLQV